MRPKEQRETGQKDLFKARLDQIVDMSHPLAKLAGAIDWGFLENKLRYRLQRQAGTSAACDQADGGARHPEAHARSFRRGFV